MTIVTYPSQVSQFLINEEKRKIIFPNLLVESPTIIINSTTILDNCRDKLFFFFHFKSCNSKLL